jgi:hypothetical protein
MYVVTLPYDFCLTSPLSKFNATNFDKYHINTEVKLGEQRFCFHDYLFS